MIATKQQRFPTIGLENQQKSTTTNTTTNTIAPPQQQPKSTSSLSAERQQVDKNEKAENEVLAAATSDSLLYEPSFHQLAVDQQQHNKDIIASKSHEATTSETNLAPRNKVEAPQSSEASEATPPRPEPSLSSPPSSNEFATDVTASYSTKTMNLPSVTSRSTVATMSTGSGIFKKSPLVASTKIQQRQQKFLAAAAKSATGIVTPAAGQRPIMATVKGGCNGSSEQAPTPAIPPPDYQPQEPPHRLGDRHQPEPMRQQTALAPLIFTGDKYLPEASHSGANARNCNKPKQCGGEAQLAENASAQLVNAELTTSGPSVSINLSKSDCENHMSTVVEGSRLQQADASSSPSTSPSDTSNSLLQHHHSQSKAPTSSTNIGNLKYQQVNINSLQNHSTSKSHHFIKGFHDNSQQSAGILATTHNSTQHHNPSDHPVNTNCANNYKTTKSPTTSTNKHQDHHLDHHKQDPSILTTPNLNKQGNPSCSIAAPNSTNSNNSTNNSINNQHQRQQYQQHLHNFNNNLNHHQSLNNNNHHHPHHHNHHNHQVHMNQLQHQYQNQQQQQQLQNSTMAHYKFHNDCQSSVLTYEQVKRLDFVMDQVVPIHGRGNFPTLYVKLKELIRLVRHKLQSEHSIEIRDVRLNGGAANFVLAPENSHYNDLDLIFGTDLSDESRFDVIRDVVLECLREFYPMPRNDSANCYREEQQNCYNQLIESSSNESPSGGIDNKTAAEHAADRVTESYTGSGYSISERFDSSKKQHRVASMASDNNTCDSKTGKTNSTIGDNGKVQSSDKNDTRSVHGAATISIDAGDDMVKKNCGHKYDSLHTGACSSHEQDYATNDRNLDQQQANLLVNGESIGRFHYQHPHQMPLNNCAIKEAYVHKMVKVNDDDRWSLISLGVQQSEAICCSQTGCLPSMTVSASPMGFSSCERQSVEPGNRQWQQLSVSGTTANESEHQQLPTNQTNAQLESQNAVAIDSRMQQLQATYLSRQQDDHSQQQKQFPNSIELKFVDRMRRKFEFSVDSFQIILDSLIQFYDYAPQSSISSQWQFVSSHSTSTMIITRPLINNRRRCFGRCSCPLSENITILENRDHHHAKTTKNSRDCPHKSTNSDANLGCPTEEPYMSHHTGRSPTNYYQRPQLEPANSPPISSEASSSGCSSSSSVVSSSSSMSCDEDHEDLYGDTYGASSSASSSSSTSSLLGSTAASLISSEGNVNELVPHDGGSDHISNKTGVKSAKMLRNLKSKSTTSETSLINHESFYGKLKENSATARPPSAASASTKAILLSSECRDCAKREQQNSHCHLSEGGFDLNRTSCAVISENFYPTVIGRSEYGDFKEALYHLEKKFIATRSPEEIRGGGLLKYCNLLVKSYKPCNSYQIRTLERYMCSRFFIDFSDLNQQQAKLESYLANHFSDDPILKFSYLTILHNVVSRSTVCLMNHELRLTLNMIRDLAYKLNEHQQHHHQIQHQGQSSQQQPLVAPPQAQQQHPYVQSQSQIQAQPQHHQSQQQQQFYHQQKPILVQSGVYRVKLVNYTLAKPVGSS